MSEINNTFVYDDYAISFSDNSMIEAKGNYDKLKELFDEDFYGSAYWMVETQATMIHESGAANMTIHFFSDKRVIIQALELSTSEVHYCPDIPLLSAWAQLEGWNLPEPSNDLVRESEDFWKFFYDTSMIYSEFLEKKYGKIEVVYEDDDLEDDFYDDE